MILYAFSKIETILGQDSEAIEYAIGTGFNEIHFIEKWNFRTYELK